MEGLKNEIGIENAEKSIMKEYEYHDVDNNLMATIRFRYEKIFEGDLAKSVILSNPQGEQVDLLEECNASKNGVKVFLHGYEKNIQYLDGYNPERNTVFAPFPETPTELAILMHELGHSEQWHDEETKPIAQADSRDTIRTEPLSKEIERILTVIPQVNSPAVAEELDRIKTLEDEIFRIRIERDAPVTEQPPELGRIRLLLKEKSELYYEYIKKTRTLRTLPRMLMERDATRRAFQHAREFEKKYHMPLFSKALVPVSRSAFKDTHVRKLAGSSPCIKSLSELISAIEQNPEDLDMLIPIDFATQLKVSLTTYNATSQQLRPQIKNLTGKSFVPKLKNK